MRAAVLFAGLGAGVALGAPNPPDYERPPINYSHTAAHDAIARFRERVAAGEFALTGSDLEILRGVLRELNVPEASQLLVFSKTSAQESLIAPDSPRALYFADSVYVGYVPGGLIEAIAIDPALGPVFYAFDPQDARDRRRTFVRETSCLRCHGGTFSREYPGLFDRSVVASATGEVLSGRENDFVGEATPFAHRWGGWYVTGYLGRESHRGNAFGCEEGERVVFEPAAERPADLSGRIAPGKYLANTSDVVALFVFQHQLDMHDSLIRAAQRTRRALADPTGAEDAVLDAAADDVADHLLFRGAAQLPAGVDGSPAFREAFERNARRARRGDSLKDFSLRGRLFANRCSYLIYSEDFSALPAPLKTRVFTRLGEALREGGPNGRFGYLERGERRRIREILKETLPETGPL